MPARSERTDALHHLWVAWNALRRRLTGLFQVAEAWMERSRQRRELATLSDAVLKDLGLSRTDIETERRKPFWRS